MTDARSINSFLCFVLFLMYLFFFMYLGMYVFAVYTTFGHTFSCSIFFLYLCFFSTLEIHIEVIKSMNRIYGIMALLKRMFNVLDELWLFIESEISNLFLVLSHLFDLLHNSFMCVHSWN